MGLKEYFLNFNVITLETQVDKQNCFYCLKKIFQNIAGNNIIFDPKSAKFSAAKSACLIILSASFDLAFWLSYCLKFGNRGFARRDTHHTRRPFRRHLGGARNSLWCKQDIKIGCNLWLSSNHGWKIKLNM